MYFVRAVTAFGCWVVLCAASFVWSAGEEVPGECSGNLYQLRAVCPAPAGSSHLQVIRNQGAMVFYVASGNRVFRAVPGEAAREVGRFATKVTQLTERSGVPVAVTEGGTVYAFRPGERPALLCGTEHVLFVDFTELKLYGGRPYGLVFQERGPPRVCRFAPSGGSPFAPLSREAMLAAFWKPVCAWRFCEIPGHWSLLGLGRRGSLWWIDSLGETQPWVADRRLSGARDFAVDRKGFYNHALLVACPARREILAVRRGEKVKTLVRGIGAQGESVGGICLGPEGTAYVVVGARIVAIEPSVKTRFGKSAALVRSGWGLLREGKYREARGVFQKAMVRLQYPEFWVRHLKKLLRRCEGAEKLALLKKKASGAKAGRFFRQALALEKAYGDVPELREELSYFRKRCETATRVAIVTDFEDKVCAPSGFKVPVPAPSSGKIRRASLPEPVHEGQYSLKWIVPAWGGEVRRLSLRSLQWGHADDIGTISLWVYSPQSGYRVHMYVFNTLNVVTGEYSIRLKRGWQKLRRPPVFLGLQAVPPDLTVDGIALEAISPGPLVLYLDDVRVTYRRPRH